VTEQRFTSTSQYRCKATTLLGEAGVTDRVDATVEAMQSARGNGASDRSLRVAERTGQLPNGDDPVLPARQSGQGVMRARLTFPSHTDGKVERGVFSPPLCPPTGAKTHLASCGFRHVGGRAPRPYASCKDLN
jgi:hypothetical protein